MQLAGVPVPGRDVLELAGLVRDDGSMTWPRKLETAYDRETIVLALTVRDGLV